MMANGSPPGIPPGGARERVSGRRRTAAVFLAAILTVLGISAGNSSGQSRQVLILHSYHSGLTWTDSVMDGIKRGFSESKIDVQLSAEYLDARRYPDPASSKPFRDLILLKLQTLTPDLILVSDNSALAFLLEFRQRLFPQVPVVFCGINDFHPSMIMEHRQITGVAEEISVLETVQLAMRLQPETREIIVIGRTSVPADKANRDSFTAALSDLPSQLKVRFWDDFPLQELKTKLEELRPGSVVFINGLLQDETGHQLMYGETTRWISRHSPVPAYSFWDVYLGHGIVGGKLVSGYHQGKTAAQLGLRILKGESADHIPVITGGQANLYMFDYRQLERFHIPSSALPDNAKVLHLPEAFYHRHKKLVWVTGAIIATLSLFVVLLASSILRRRRAEAALRESEEKYRELVQNANSIILRMDPQGKITFFNEYAESFFGYRQEEILGKSVLETILPEKEHGGRDLRAVLRDTITHPEDHPVQEHQNIRRNGERVWIAWGNKPIRDDRGDLVEILCVGNDVTERRQAEEALRESELRWQFALEGAGDGLWDWNTRTDEVYFSPQWKAMLGYGEEEIPHRLSEWDRRVHPEDKEYVYREIERHFSGQTPLYTSEHRLLCKDGTYKWILDRGKVIRRDEDGKPLRMIGTHTDMTERRRGESDRIEMERQLLYAQKLESLGVLAGGIAHDFNNLLMVILGNLDLALHEIPSQSSAAQSIEQAILASRRAADLTLQMLAYSGKGRYFLEDFSVGELIRENAHLLRASISKHSALVVQTEANLPHIRADRGQVQQVLMNLITNASEAMGEKGGAIRVHAGVGDFDRAELARSKTDEKPPPGPYVFVEVRDTGCGMNEETLRRLFEPFFTTKFLGRGLGMAAVLGIVRAHHGAIFVDSKNGEGTNVTVLFPVSGEARPAAEEIEERQKEVSPAVEPSGDVSTRAILVVDDEDLVLEVCGTMLESLGYRILTATNGEEGVKVFEEHAGDILCVFLDLTMPRMDGVRAFHEMRRIRPDVTVILVSGYSQDEATQRFAGEGLAAFLQKPFGIQKLATTLKEALGHERP